jgi:hypothetical protein
VRRRFCTFFASVNICLKNHHIQVVTNADSSNGARRNLSSVDEQDALSNPEVLLTAHDTTTTEPPTALTRTSDKDMRQQIVALIK